MEYRITPNNLLSKNTNILLLLLQSCHLIIRNYMKLQMNDSRKRTLLKLKSLTENLNGRNSIWAIKKRPVASFMSVRNLEGSRGLGVPLGTQFRQKIELLRQSLLPVERVYRLEWRKQISLFPFDGARVERKKKPVVHFPDARGTFDETNNARGKDEDEKREDGERPKPCLFIYLQQGAVTVSFEIVCS